MTFTTNVLQDCSTYIAKSVTDEFLRKALLGPLTQADEKAALTTTAVLTKLFQMVRSRELIREMTRFIVDDQVGEDGQVLRAG